VWGIDIDNEGFRLTLFATLERLQPSTALRHRARRNRIQYIL